MAQKKKAPQAKPQAKAGGNNRVFLMLVGVVAVAGVGWWIATSGGGGGSTGPLPTPAEFEQLAMGLEGDPSVGIPEGAEGAPILIEEFIDYSCPACANFAGFAGRLLRQNYVEPEGGPVRWVVYDYVLGSFPNSVSAAMAARCAGEQGRYWPMHDVLFARADRWRLSSDPGAVYDEIASELGVETGQYRECMQESRYLDDIAISRKFGDSRGVGSTPTVFFDGQMLNLSRGDPYALIEGLIKAKLESGAPDESEGE